MKFRIHIYLQRSTWRRLIQAGSISEKAGEPGLWQSWEQVPVQSRRRGPQESSGPTGTSSLCPGGSCCGALPAWARSPSPREDARGKRGSTLLPSHTSSFWSNFIQGFYGWNDLFFQLSCIRPLLFNTTMNKYPKLWWHRITRIPLLEKTMRSKQFPPWWMDSVSCLPRKSLMPITILVLL